MTRSGLPLREYHLAKKFDADIKITKQLPGEVPEFECREAAVFVHVSWQQWVDNMDGWERAKAVAHYRVSLALKAHVEDAAERAANRKKARQQRHQRRTQ